MEAARGLETAFLGALDGQLTGLLVLRTGPTLSDAKDWAEITELYVRPDGRRRGIGRSLVEAAIRYARSRNCTEIRLLVDPENAVALSFYRTVGFSRDSWEMRRGL
jgi:ribosomal protein S18 acetylase RimI-like enzyme